MNYLQEPSRDALLEAYFTSKTDQYYTHSFQLKFSDVPVPSKQTVDDLVSCFHETESVKDGTKKWLPVSLNLYFSGNGFGLQ